MILRGVIRAINTAKNMYLILTLIHMEIISYFCDASLASCAVILNSIKNCTPILVYDENYMQTLLCANLFNSKTSDT